MEVYEPAALTSPEAIKPCGQFRGARWSCRPPAAPTPRSRPRQAGAKVNRALMRLVRRERAAAG